MQASSSVRFRRSARLPRPSRPGGAMVGAATVLCWGLVGAQGLGSARAAAPQGPAQPVPAIATDKPQLVASVHARNLDATLAMVRDYVPVPLKPEGVLRDLFGELGALVSLTAPASLVVAVDPQDPGADTPPPPLLGYVVGVRNLEEARRALSGTRVVVDSKGSELRLSLPVRTGTLPCLLAPGGGAGAGRLACAKGERARDLLGPYLVRTSPPPQNSDLHAEIDVEAIMRAYEPAWRRVLQMVGLIVPGRLQLGQPEFDRAITDATQALIGQIAAMSHDLQSATLDLSLAKTGIDAHLRYRMIGGASWWAQAESEAAGRPGPGVPASFFTLPADATSASFQSSDPKYARRIVALLLPLLDGYLAHDGLAAADRSALMDALNKLVNASGPALLTSAVAVGKSDSAAPPPSSGFEPASIFGGSFYLIANEGTTNWAPDIKELVAAYNRPGVQSYLRARWKKLDPGGTPPVLRAEPLPKGVGAGAYAVTFSGNLAALVKSPGKPVSPRPKPVTLHAIMVPMGERTLTAFGADRPTLLRRLAEQGKLPPERTLASRPGLEALREPTLRGGGFTSLVAMTSYLDAFLSLTGKGSVGEAAQKDRPQSSAQLFNMVPHHGEAPMVYLSRTGNTPGRGLQSELTLQIPRLVIEDLAALTMQLALNK